MLKYLAPSGSPIKTSEFLYWIICNLLFLDKRSALKDELKKRYSHDYNYLFTTGRGAMTLLLRSLAEMNKQKNRIEVVIPAYTCYSVASSIVNAGLKIRICDINPETLSYDLDNLKKIPFENVLCVITSNLYGIPNQLVELENIADSNNVYLIDDAAQSLNAKYSGRYLGTFGVAGLYSFDKGKNITSIDGGVVVTSNKELSEIINKHYQQLLNCSKKQNLVTAAKVIVYYIFLNPILYWLPASLPFLNLGKTRYEYDISIKRYSRIVAPLALKQLKRSEHITDERVKNGNWYKNNLNENKELSKIIEFQEANPVYLRYPVKINDKTKREAILKHTKRYGITNSYPKPLHKLEEISQYLVSDDDFDGANKVAEQIITLPTHAYVSNQNKSTLNRILKKYLIKK
ncbi:MAG: DegT/DnrJ/EryC1/StrS family aminotransferase [Candidatus Thiodiazotropha sp.]